MSSSHVYEVAPKDGEAADKRNTKFPWKPEQYAFELWF